VNPDRDGELVGEGMSKGTIGDKPGGTLISGASLMILNMRHRVGLIAACLFLFLGGTSIAQQSSASETQIPTNPAQPPSPAAQAAALPAWAVSTVKPSSPDARGSLIRYMSDGIKITNMNLMAVVVQAFGVEPDHVLTGPNVARIRGNFDIEAKVAPEDAPKMNEMKIDQQRPMVVALLEERFGLKFHHETRDLPLYELVVAKGGAKIQASKLIAEPGEASRLFPELGQPPSPGRHMFVTRGLGHIESTEMGMSALAEWLSRQLGRTVVDKTGLTGDFHYKLDWTPDYASSLMPTGSNPALRDNAVSKEAAGPSLFTALEEQLGLKLKSTRGPVDVIVIDHIDRPAEN